jgi:prepilin-type N-terminal cleavage/methylation domain-containing protein
LNASPKSDVNSPHSISKQVDFERIDSGVVAGLRTALGLQSPFALACSRKTARNGFTLIEVLTAVSVLSLLVVMISALMNTASITVASSSKRLSADDEARMVFDRMQLDFARMLKRNDVWFQFTRQADGNDQFSFYSETPGFLGTGATTYTESNLSLVNYQIPSATSNANNLPNNQLYQLQRLGQGYQWTDSDVKFSPTSAPTVIPANFHVISNSVFRMETAFLMRVDDTTVEITNTPPNPGPQAFQNCYAVIVALGVLDSNSQKLVTATTDNFPKLVAALPPVADGSTPATISLKTTSTPNASTMDPILNSWRNAMAASNFAQTAGIPTVAAQQVRVYQRIFYLQ